LVPRFRLPTKQNPIVQEYCLPDFTPSNPRGYIKSGPNAVPPPEQAEGTAATGEEHVVNMSNERFSVPEVLFNPGDIGGSCLMPPCSV
jgi:actin-related protein 6